MKRKYANKDLEELKELANKNISGASGEVEEYQRMLDIEKEIGLKQEAKQKAFGTGISAIAYANMVTDNGLKGMSDDAFTVADNLEELYRGGDDEMRKRVMATNPQAVATKAKEEGKEVKPIAAAKAEAKAEAAPVGSDVVAVAKTSTDLQDLLDKAFAFDRAAEEKAIKQQQGFDIAALGVQLMSTPLNKIDPALISNLGVTNKELAGLDEKEAKKLLQRKLTGLEIKKAEKELNAAGDLVPLPSNVMDLVDAYAGATAFNKANSNEVQSVIDKAQKRATALSLAEGLEPDTERAASIFRDELQREINEASKVSGTGVNNPNQGVPASQVGALPSRQLGLPQ